MCDKHRRRAWFTVSFIGLGSLVWFLTRVIAKPSRVNYPCMRVAAPMASTFLLWLFGIATSMALFRRARKLFSQSRYIVASGCLAAVAVTGAIFFSSPIKTAFASIIDYRSAPNDPIGVAQGINPGRVVWVHDSKATNWAGNGDGHWWESSHADQTVVDRMVSRTIRELSGKKNDAEAWDAFFRYFNKTHNLGDKGYTAGEKITIKVNLVGCIIGQGGWGGVDANSLDFYKKPDYMNISPQMMLSFLRQLVKVVGAKQTDISIGDPTTYFPNQFYTTLHTEFPDVVYIDCQGTKGRTRAVPSTVPFYFSCRPNGVEQDYVPKHYAEATYLINFGTFKSHSMAGVTLGAKNHLGSLIRLPNAPDYYDMHTTMPKNMPAMKSYRVLVDLLGHAQLGGKTMLSLIDGLYGGVHPDDTVPFKWKVAPFNDDWTSSLFASQDPVALESVLFDLMQLEGDPRKYPQIAGTEDYLIEAALANDPPSKTFYDPDHATNTERLKSLGVHERWNNDSDRKYSKNLGTGNGIELIAVEGSDLPVMPIAKPAVSPAAFSVRDGGMLGRGWAELTLPKGGAVTLDIFDGRGKLLGKAIDGYLAAGSYKVKWTDALGGVRVRPGGMYVLVLASRTEKATLKVAYAE